MSQGLQEIQELISNLEGVYVTGSRYIIHFYCLVVETIFYSDMFTAITIFLYLLC